MSLAIIPARYDSSRFPGKPLANRTGRPLIQHVVEQVRLAKSIDRIVVATDDQRIYDAVAGFGGEVMMTQKDHPNGTSRLGEVVQCLDNVPDVVVNVQGDEPEIEPWVIDRLAEGLRSQPPWDQSSGRGGPPMATLGSSFAPDEDPADTNIVKLVVDRQGMAMYFSRSLIPFPREDQGRPSPRTLKHPGLYAYRPEFLVHYPTLKPTEMEQIECLEQLRVLEHGYQIAVVAADVRHHGIDTPEQYEAFVRRYEARGQ
jgi:3-deoxy-manno-octulosonate cytidylyltransferase (CMP-KDO synthetase)